jgi:hypothetical protein
MSQTLNYVCGAGDGPLLCKTVRAALEDTAARDALVVSRFAPTF